MKKDDKRRPLSLGTVFMLSMLAVVLVGSVAVLGRLSSGASVDLSKLNMEVLDLQNGLQESGNSSNGAAGTAARPAEKPSGFPEKTANASVSDNTTQKEAGEGSNPKQQADKGTNIPSAGNQAAAAPAEGVYTLTVGGSVSLEGEVLKNAWNTESKTYDLSDTMLLLKPELQSNLNAVFLENIITDNEKANDTVAPEDLADLLQESGFGMSACGFSKAYDKGPDGVAGTWMALDERGIFVTGIRLQDKQNTPEIRTLNGIKTAFLQYTGTVPQKTRKKMVKADTTRMVPEAEISLITEEIDTVRRQGAEAVIVLLKWGKTENRPDSSQRELAMRIAKAGADLIIGSGSRIPQGAEYLDGPDGSKVLCIWSLGSLLTGDRKHTAGYLLHVTVRKNANGGTDILAPEYTPVYTWKYKQDGRYYYRCLASDQPAPDGMDSEQQKVMSRAEKTVSETLADSPLTLRSR